MIDMKLLEEMAGRSIGETPPEDLKDILQAVIYICVCDFIGSIAKKSWNFIAEYLILIHHRFGNNIAVLP